MGMPISFPAYLGSPVCMTALNNGYQKLTPKIWRPWCASNMASNLSWFTVCQTDMNSKRTLSSKWTIKLKNMVTFEINMLLQILHMHTLSRFLNLPLSYKLRKEIYFLTLHNWIHLERNDTLRCDLCLTNYLLPRHIWSGMAWQYGIPTVYITNWF